MNNRAKAVVVEGIAANLLFGTLFVWSVLRNPLLELFPTWNEGMLSFVFGIHNLFTCAGILLGGVFCRRHSPRRVFLLFVLLTFIGLSGFALLPEQHPTLSYAMVFVLFCCFAATGVGIGINVVQSTTIPWFPKNSGVISGALYMALGVSSVVLAFIAQRLLPLIGVRLVMPVFGCIILAVSLLILADKSSIKPPTAEKASVSSQQGARPGQMVKSAAFIVLVLWNICLRTAGLTLLDHAASIASAFGGFALTAMLIAPANGLGCISVGAAMDRLGMKRIMLFEAALMIFSGILLCSGIHFGTYALIFAGLLVGGFSYGGSSSSYAASIKNIFGAKFYTQNFAVSNLAMGIAALMESVSGSLLDAGGGYMIVVLSMVLLLGAVALILSLFAKKSGI